MKLNPAAAGALNRNQANRDKLLEKLRGLAGDDVDIEYNHMVADDALIEFIGDSEIEEAYEAISKWYA